MRIKNARLSKNDPISCYYKNTSFAKDFAY